MKSKIFFYILFAIYQFFFIQNNYCIEHCQTCDDNILGVIINPVVDIFSELDPDLSDYKTIPLSPLNKKDKLSCPRLHQLLFNDIVKVIKQENNEYIIEVMGFFFQTK